MQTSHGVVAAILLLALLAAALLWYGNEPASPIGAREHTPPPGGSTLIATPPEQVANVDPQRESIPTPTEPEFVSKDDEGNVVASAVRDGLAVLAIHADRTPCADTRIDVRWRRGFGLYGNDTGRTDAAGRFATTVAEFEMLEDITLHHPKFGELANWQAMLPMANDPRTVCVVVPAMAPVQLRLVDLQHRPIAGGTIKVTRKSIDSNPREYALASAEVAATPDDQGRAVLQLPVGQHEFVAEAPAHRALQKLSAEVPVGGRSLTMTLLPDEPMRDVAVTVLAPPDLKAPIQVSGFSMFVPEHLLGQERTTSEPVQRRFDARRMDAHHFTVAVDALPWRLTAHAPGCEWAWVDVPALQTAATITLVGSAKTPKARLLCQVVVPASHTAFPVVRVHETPDLVHGSDHQLDRNGRVVIELEPKGRVCVSARAMFQLPPTIVGPIDLLPGDHEVRIELVAPQVVRGRVVDGNGNPVAAHVNLRRPAGVLRQLADGVPEILEWTADGDSLTVRDGIFAFKDLGPGTHEIYAQPQAIGWPGRSRFEAGDENVVIVLGQGMQGMALIHGTVTDASTGQPLPGAEVHSNNDKVTQTRHTDAEGRFTLVMPPGPVTMTAFTRRCVLYRAALTFPVGEGRCDIALSPSTPLFVRVVDAAGGPLADIDVGALDANGVPIVLINEHGSQDGESQPTNTAGRAELRGLPDGALRLVMQRGEEKKEVALPLGTRRDVAFEVRW